jgi:hypothetical protein
MNATMMNRPQLVDQLMKWGHKYRLLQKLPLDTLKKWVTEERHYNPSSQDQTPQAPQEPSQAPQNDDQDQNRPQSQPQPSQPQAPAQNPGKVDQAQIDDILNQAERRILPKTDARDVKVKTDILRDLDTRIEAIEQRHPREVVITVKTDKPEPVKLDNMGPLHCMFAVILKWLLLTKRPKHVYAFGDRGAGKTTIARQLNEARAKVLGVDLPFFTINFHKTTQPHDLLGYMSPQLNGPAVFVETEFYRWCRDGGTILLDEFDAAGMLAGAINSALANGYCVFANGRMNLHKTCRAIAAGNTTGKGATIDYVGRERQDAATLDRFVFVPVNYDEALELQLAESHGQAWALHVQKIRKTIRAMGPSAPDLCPGTRAILSGADMIENDPTVSFTELEAALVWQGCDEESILRVRSTMARQ